MFDIPTDDTVISTGHRFGLKVGYGDFEASIMHTLVVSRDPEKPIVLETTACLSSSGAPGSMEPPPAMGPPRVEAAFVLGQVVTTPASGKETNGLGFDVGVVAVSTTRAKDSPIVESTMDVNIGLRTPNLTPGTPKLSTEKCLPPMSSTLDSLVDLTIPDNVKLAVAVIGFMLERLLGALTGDSKQGSGKPDDKPNNMPCGRTNNPSPHEATCLPSRSKTCTGCGPRIHRRDRANHTPRRPLPPLPLAGNFAQFSSCAILQRGLPAALVRFDLHRRRSLPPVKHTVYYY